jgi:hypothetical protein
MLPPTGKSTLSLWKLITFYPNKQIWPNKVIKLKQFNGEHQICLSLIVGIVFWEINI